MGELIRFRPRKGAKPPVPRTDSTDRAGAGGATILLFTGVRYERHEESPALAPKRQSPRGSRRKRA